MRDEKKIFAKPPQFAQTGWWWSTSIKFLDQHHPGASRHPSSAEEGTSIFTLPLQQFIHRFIDRAYGGPADMGVGNRGVCF